LADGAQRRPANLPYTLSDRVGRGIDLACLLVQEKMVVAEMGTRYVPVKILCLQVQDEHVGEQNIKGTRKLLTGIGPEVGR
jgi:hypothetical protein